MGKQRDERNAPGFLEGLAHAAGLFATATGGQRQAVALVAGGGRAAVEVGRAFPEVAGGGAAATGRDRGEAQAMAPSKRALHRVLEPSPQAGHRASADGRDDDVDLPAGSTPSWARR